MTELFINKERVYLGDGVSVKLVDENPYFTKSEKYTYDIEVPLKGNPNNLKIFGNLQRIDVSKTIVEMPAYIIADNRCVINGTATVTSVTEDKIKIQILSGTAELNFQSKYEKQYVNELNLGYATKPDGSTVGSDEQLRSYVDSLTPEERYKFMFGTFDQTKCCFFPVYKSEFSSSYNNLGLFRDSDGTYSVHMDSLYYYDNKENPIDISEGIRGNVKGRIAVQPYLGYVVRLVFQALGYSVLENHIETSALKNILIANANNVTDFGQCLPHWTVAEFMTHIEHFFGVVFRIDDSNKSVRIISREVFYTTGNSENIDRSLEEYTVSSDAEETKDISDSNISYSFAKVDTLLKIDDEIVKKAELKEFDTYEEAVQNTRVYNANRYGKIYDVKGKQYIFYGSTVEGEDEKTYALKEVNQFRNLTRNEKDESSSIELKIVPVEMYMGHQRWDNGAVMNLFLKIYGKFFQCPMMAPSNFTYEKENVNIQEEIEGNSNNGTDSQDLLEVAYNDGSLQTVQPDTGYSYKFPWPFVRTGDILNGEKNRGFSFELNQVDGRNTMYDAVFGQLSKINTKSEYCIKFITDKMPDVMKRFVIHNRTFICEKIEYKITAKGIDQEKTGYFYEANS